MFDLVIKNGWAVDGSGAPGFSGKVAIQQAEGIHMVIINGEVVLKENQPTGALPGRVVRGV